AGGELRAGKLMQVTPIVGKHESMPERVRLAKELDYSSMMIAPMIRDGKTVGAIATAHREAVAFDDKQVALLKAFADQAVIAIENARLFNETSEALERQTATAEILNVISGSPTDVQPVFDAILDKALRLCDASLGTLGLYDGKIYRWVTQRGANAKFAKWLKSTGGIEPAP